MMFRTSVNCSRRPRLCATVAHSTYGSENTHLAPSEYRSLKSADRRMATGAAWLNRKKIMARTANQKVCLDIERPSHRRTYTQFYSGASEEGRQRGLFQRFLKRFCPAQTSGRLNQQPKLSRCFRHASRGNHFQVRRLLLPS